MKLGETMKQSKLVRSLALAVVLHIGVAAGAPGDEIRHHGEPLDPARYGAGVIEAMDEVLARQKQAPAVQDTEPAQARYEYGVWAVPNIRGTKYPASGEHNVVNKKGDVRMGIGFAELVHVHGAYFAGQGGEGATTKGVYVVGYRGGEEVGRTDWLRGLDDVPTWLEMDLKDVDRIVIFAEPTVRSAGWYGMDDFTYTSRTDGRMVLDFEDVPYATTLSGSGYMGLTWEWGTGFEVPRFIHAPMEPPGLRTQAAPPSQGTTAHASRGTATLPEMAFEFSTVRRGDGGMVPPDTCGAIGPNHYVVAVNEAFAIYDKTDGDEISSVSWGSFLPGSRGDPRILFDQHSQRWFVIASDFDSGGNIHVAVSLTDDPTGAWYKTSFHAAEGVDSGRWADYPTLGLDENGVYVASYMVGGTQRMTLFAIDKAPLVAPTPSLGTVTAFRDLPWDGAIQCAHTYGSPGTEYCVSLLNSAWMRIRRVDPPLTAPTLTETTIVPIPLSINPPDAPAAGSTVDLDTVGNRLMNAVYRDGSVWTTHAANVDGRSAVRWYEVDVETGELIQSGTISDPDISFFFPSIAVNRYGDVAMGFTGSSAIQYAAAYYTGRRRTDDPGEMATPVRYEFGNATYNVLDNYGRNRWGDYSLTTVDPVDGLTFWTLQEHVASENIWGTQVAVIHGGDCNDNDRLDQCDMDCGEPGGPCDVPGCGTSEDCDADNIPDECEDVIGACCFTDGACCDLLTEEQCTPWGIFYGGGLGCDDAIDPPCLPAETFITCELSAPSALAGSSVMLELFIEQVSELTGYQVEIAITRVSGSGTLALDCDGCPGETCAARVDSVRMDYVFAGESSFPGANCPLLQVAAAGLNPVAVGENPAYLGEYQLTVSGDATPGSVFEVAVVDNPTITQLRDAEQYSIRFQTGPVCTLTVAAESDCLAPVVTQGGSRYLLVTPVGPNEQALLVTGDPSNPDIACVSKYVQGDGSLGDAAVFMPGPAWGTVAVHGTEIIPSVDPPFDAATYLVQAQCTAEFSTAASVTTWMWGDVYPPPNNLVNIDDILALIRVFQGDLAAASQEQADIDPCMPNRATDIGDILKTLGAFQGQSFEDAGCSLPCS